MSYYLLPVSEDTFWKYTKEQHEPFVIFYSMDIGSRLFAIFQTILFLIIIISACIYSIPIICIRRFRHNNNIFTVNVCLATILNCLSWLPFHVWWSNGFYYKITALFERCTDNIYNSTTTQFCYSISSSLLFYSLSYKDLI
jgi:hypothetical protein